MTTTPIKPAATLPHNGHHDKNNYRRNQEQDEQESVSFCRVTHCGYGSNSIVSSQAFSGYLANDDSK